VRCSYPQDPTKEFSGESFQGTMAGIQVFRKGYVAIFEDTVPSPNTPAAPTSTTESIASDVSLSNPLFLGTGMTILTFSFLAHEAFGANFSCRREFVVALVVKMFFARF
jgi:hypothetical protein